MSTFKVAARCLITGGRKTALLVLDTVLVNFKIFRFCEALFIYIMQYYARPESHTSRLPRRNMGRLITARALLGKYLYKNESELRDLYLQFGLCTSQTCY